MLLLLLFVFFSWPPQRSGQWAGPPCIYKRGESNSLFYNTNVWHHSHQQAVLCTCAVQPMISLTTIWLCADVGQDDCEKLACFLEEALGKHWGGASTSPSSIVLMHWVAPEHCCEAGKSSVAKQGSRLELVLREKKQGAEALPEVQEF